QKDTTKVITSLIRTDIMTKISYYKEFPVGWLEIQANGSAITNIDYREEGNSNAEENDIIKQCIDELEEYFQGKRQVFDVPIDVREHGTELKRKVWQELNKISYCEKISYKTLECRISGSNYSRAVANANSKNPISIIIPCHRVIACDGGLGGYTGGLNRKKVFLKIEASC